MAKVSKDDLMKSIEEMSVLELADLVKALEEKFGVSTYTAAAVYGALQTAADLAKLLGKVKNEDICA